MRRALLVALLLAGTALTGAGRAGAAEVPSITGVFVYGSGPGDLIDAQGNGFEARETVRIVMVGGNGSLPLTSARTDGLGRFQLSKTTRVSLTATPGDYRLTATSASGSTATSLPFTIWPPTVVMPARLRPGQPASTTDAATFVRLAGLANGPDVTRTVTVDDVPVATAWWNDQNVRTFRGIGFAVPSDLPVGDHRVTFTQTGATPYTTTVVVPVVPPSFSVSAPLGTDARMQLTIEGAGCDGDTLEVTVVGAAGDRHAGQQLTVPDYDSCFTSYQSLTVTGLSSGTATMTAVSRRNGAVSTVAFPVAGSAVTAPGGLAAGQRIVSSGTRTQLVMQGDGNLVLYDIASVTGSVAMWSSRTNGHPGSRFVLQADGNGVVYSPTGEALWATGTSGIGRSASLRVTSDNVLAGLELRTGAGRLAWSSLAATPGPVLSAGGYLYRGAYLSAIGLDWSGANHTLTMQPDGNVVVRSSSRGPLWSTRTQGHPNSYLVLQPDGQLVVRGPDERVLWTNGIRATNARLVMQDDGNLVEYSPTGKALWATRTLTP